MTWLYFPAFHTHPTLLCFLLCLSYVLIRFIWVFLREQIKGRYVFLCFFFWFSAKLFEVCMPHSSICNWYPFHSVSSHISFIFRILMCCTVRSHCYDWLKKSSCMTAFFCIIRHIVPLQIWHDGGECMSVYLKGRGNVRDRGSWRGRREVRRGGIWQLLKKKRVREMETFRKLLEGAEGEVRGNERGTVRRCGWVGRANKW